MGKGKGSDEDGECRRKCLHILKQNAFLIFLLFGIILGVVIGSLIKHYNPDFHTDKRSLMYLAFPGDLLLRMLKCMIIPLIVTSLISGMAAIPGQASGRLGGFAVLYYMITTIMAALLGILLVCTIKPGERGQNMADGSEDRLVQPVDALLDLIRNALTDNIIAACFTQVKTSYSTATVVVGKENVTSLMNVTTGNMTKETNVTKLVNLTESEITGFSVGSSSGTNVLGLVVFSIVLGVVIGQMAESGLPVRRFVDSLQEAIIRVVKLIIWYSPIGICFILAARIAGMADPLSEFERLGWYMMTVLVGLFIHAFITLPLIYLIFARKNPFVLMYHMCQALLTALGTASSSATLPITMKCLEENAKVDRRVSRFVLPVGATINMDGTALYEAVASIFIAQINQIPLNAGQIVTVSITATAAAIGAAGVPEAGLVTMLIVLTAVGLPTEDVALIFAVDWLLDRFRTSVNVWGDCIGAGVVEGMCKEKLELMDEEENDQKRLDDDFEYPEEVKKPEMNGRQNHSFQYDTSRL